jgi:hypothetical protein
VIADLQALRGIKSVSSATIVAEVWPGVALRATEAADGLQRHGLERTRLAAACAAARSPRRATPTGAASSVRRLGRTTAAPRPKGKLRQKLATAIGRELLGFIWAAGPATSRGRPAGVLPSPVRRPGRGQGLRAAEACGGALRRWPRPSGRLLLKGPEETWTSHPRCS